MLGTILGSLLVILQSSSPAPSARGEPLRQVTVGLAGSSPEAFRELFADDLDVLFVHPGGEAVELLCGDAELERLELSGVEYRVVHADLAAFYAERLREERVTAPPPRGAWLSPPFGQGSMGGHYTWEEVVSVLDQIADAYPDIVAPKSSLGRSHEGRDLWVVKVSDEPGRDEDEPEVRFDALHHAREPQGMQATLWALLYLVEGYGTDPLATSIVDEREIWFVPVVNPDGYVHNETTNPTGGGLWRKNRRNNGAGVHGVDLNRNYPFQWAFDDVGSSPAKGSEVYRGPGPASEPEVAAMVAFLASRRFRTALSSHTFGDAWPFPWGYTTAAPANRAQYEAVSAAATEVNGYDWGPAWQVLYRANGTTTDHEHALHRTLAWVPEIGSASDGFWPAGGQIVELSEENLDAFLRTALAAGSYPHVTLERSTDLGDGDGFFEPGERVELVYSARNVGVDATAAPVRLSLSCAHPGIKTRRGESSLDPLAPLASASNRDAPFALEIETSMRPGTRVEYTVRVDWDGLSLVLHEDFVVGRPVALVEDDLEVELGWVAGLPGDTATDGFWEYGNPKGTMNSYGQIASPEDDATPGAGKRCYVTGNGAIHVNLDDVDGGHTTLVTPRIDLSGADVARLSYSRWYADLVVPDDVFEVSISNDDGVTWVPLETVDTSTSRWVRASFRVEEHVAPTDSVRLRFVARDFPVESTVEACVDDLLVEAFEIEPRFNAYGRPRIGGNVAFHVTSPDGGAFAVLESGGAAHVGLPHVHGPLLLDPATVVPVHYGIVPASGSSRAVLPIPDDPTLIGETRYYQALVLTPAGPAFTNLDELTFE